MRVENVWADGWSTKCQLIGPEGNCTHITRPQEEEEQEATPWLGGQRRIARMVFPECLTKASGSSRDAEIIHPRSQAVQDSELLLTAQKNAIYASVY